MKKYFLGLVAVCIAVGFSAFTTVSKRDNLTLVFNGNTKSSASVSTASNWQLISEPSCSGAQVQACVVSIPDTYVTPSGSPRTLTNATISVSGNDDDGYKPTEFRDASTTTLISTTINNKP